MRRSAMLLAMVSAGCTRAPSVSVLGAYFPGWLFCITRGRLACNRDASGTEGVWPRSVDISVGGELSCVCHAAHAHWMAGLFSALKPPLDDTFPEKSD
jgi:YtcA family